MNTEELWFNIIPQILPGLQSFPSWRSHESLGLEGRGVCLWRASFPTSMNHTYNHPNCILSGEVTKTPISGPNGFLVLWVNATGMPLNKCPQKALSQGYNLRQSGYRGEEEQSHEESPRWRCNLLHPAWPITLAAHWWPGLRGPITLAAHWWPGLRDLSKHLLHLFPNHRYDHAILLQKNVDWLSSST